MTETTYGSDVAVQAMAAMGMDIAAFNPGASFRGLHESMVHIGVPEPVLCLSEAVAVAVAHGYAKAADRPMAIFLHDLVGLQSGAMGIFNAWVDQVPMLVVGGSGPSAHADRRAWIDWIHTSRAQADIVKDHVKWYGAPTSIRSVPEVLHRAMRAAMTPPYGPSYVSLDTDIQEGILDPADLGDLLDLQPIEPPRSTLPTEDTERLVQKLVTADRPVIVADHVGRSKNGYQSLTELAEQLGAPVIDLAGRHSFDNTHPLDGTSQRHRLLGAADLVLALDCRDTDFAVSDVDLRTREATALAPGARQIAVSLTEAQSTGFLEFERSVPTRQVVFADTAQLLPDLVAAVDVHLGGRPRQVPAVATGVADPADALSRPVIGRELLSAAIWCSIRSGPWQLANGHDALPVRRYWELDRYGAHLGSSGGAGLGYGIGATIGAALANRGTDTLTVGLQADGDLLYTPSGLWTAAHLGLPILFVVINNRCYGQDLKHQSAMAITRDRPAEHAHVGIDIDDPTIDIARLAEAQGVEAFGPIEDPSMLSEGLERAVRIVRDERRPVLLDVIVDA